MVISFYGGWMKNYSVNYQNKQESADLFLGKNGSAFTESELMEIFSNNEDFKRGKPLGKEVMPPVDIGLLGEEFDRSVKSSGLDLQDFQKCFSGLKQEEIKKNYMEILSDFKSSKTQYKESLKVFFSMLFIMFVVPFLGLSTSALALWIIVVTVFALWSIFKIALAIGKNWKISMKMKDGYNTNSFLFNFSNLVIFFIAPIFNFFSLSLQNKEISSKLDLFALKNGFQSYEEFEKEQKEKKEKSWWQIWK